MMLKLEPSLSQGDYYSGIFDAAGATIEVLVSDSDSPAGNKHPVFGYHIDWWELASAAFIFPVVAGLT